MDDIAVSILVLANGVQRIERELLGEDELPGALAQFERQENGRIAVGFV